LRLDGGRELNRCASYLGLHGLMTLDGAEIALAAITARGRRFQALNQRDALQRVQRLLDPGGSVRTFTLDNVADPDLRKSRTDRLRLHARGLRWPNVEVSLPDNVDLAGLPQT
ncbi:MAG: hypothetical protein QGG40_02925, partial [Myxococcota bacterium]|nr:hypothetical protein [Myxococcota bacterium]